VSASLQLAASADHPFPGLRPFAYPDHEYFFGREDQTYALYRLIDRSRFVAVVGSSGSGKSSLVRAGLLPLLDDETRESGGRSWLLREMRPGDEPLQRLTNLLASLSTGDDPAAASARRERIAAQLQRSSFGISEALAEMNGVTGKSLVMVIDQFEELFRYAATASDKTDLSPDERRAREEATQFVQLLLEASRAPSNKINVMLTMRSDFIGDCARFHGLPEAVCAAQFLVPSLTRDQLDEVIRKPVEKAGAAIDPELVERLLNDCGTEMDQLPVLQHCLSRLWDEAGKVPAATPSGAVQIGQETSAGTPTARRLSLNHYRNIGEFAEALSRHADEILKDLPGPTLQLAVEQTFSALSELDKEGRAIRRALKFSQLVAETGVDETAVRQVLDRFRADDCSFLTPSFFEVKEIGDATRIDVGHEALLRRWDKASGHGHGVELGWLRAEQQAGERYRGLLAMAEGDDAVLPSHLVDERLAWWKARPRTEKWAERYGGGFSRVKRLLLVSQIRQRVKRWTIAAAFVMVVGTAGLMAWLWWTATNAKLAATENLHAAVQAQKEADTNRIAALETTKTSVGRLAGFMNDGTLRADGAQKFLDDAEVTLKQLSEAGEHSPEISEIELSLLLAVSDVKDSLGDYNKASELAVRAERMAEHLTVKYPDKPNFKHQVYASKFRIGDQLSKDLRKNAAAAEEKYQAAFDIAQQLASSDPDNAQRQSDVTFVLDKIADINQYRRNWKTAMDQYNAGLKILEDVRQKSPGDGITREIAAQKGKIAQALSLRGEQGDDVAALAQYREVLAIQTQLLNNNPGNSTLLSNSALTHRRLGELLKDKPDEAQREYEAAVANRKQLYESDPSNMSWQTGLATEYTSLGDLLMKKELWLDAAGNYSAAISIEERIVKTKPADTGWQNRLAALNVKWGDALVHRGNEVTIEPAIDESARLIGDALGRYRAAAGNFEKLANNPKAGNPRYRDLFEVYIKTGDILVRQNKNKEALDAYQSASTTAERAATTAQSIVNWPITLSVSLEQAGDDLTNSSACCQLASREDALVYYRKALEVLDAAAIKDPGNPALQSRKSALIAKVDALGTALNPVK
jgi:tetratricopeptide (TPR) repeat protein